jgi:hypothetical protein
MDHNRAVETQATERYLLGDMSPEDRDDFEEHYFTCTICADEIRAASRFQLAAREVAREPVPVPQPKPRWEWWRFPNLAPLAATFFLGGWVVYLVGFEIPALKVGQSISSIALNDITRGADSIKTVPPGQGFFTVFFDLPSGASASSYRCTVTDAAGKVVGIYSTKAPALGEPVNLLLNRDRLAPGVYTISVRPADAADSSPPIKQERFKR